MARVASALTIPIPGLERMIDHQRLALGKLERLRATSARSFYRRTPLRG
jgi:hypothetical protein